MTTPTIRNNFVAPAAAPPELAAGSRSYTEKQFLHSWIAGFFLPLAQAFGASIVAMILTATIIFTFGGWYYGKPMLIVGGFAFVLYWGYSQYRWWKLTSEQQPRQRTTTPQTPMPPAEKIHKVQIMHIAEDKSVSYEYIQFKYANEAQLRAFSDGVINQGMTLSERVWAGKKKGRPFAIDGYRAFRQELVDRKLAMQRTDGEYELNRAGEAVFQKIYQDLSEGET
jgi:hypothetical protein